MAFLRLVFVAACLQAALSFAPCAPHPCASLPPQPGVRVIETPCPYPVVEEVIVPVPTPVSVPVAAPTITETTTRLTSTTSANGAEQKIITTSSPSAPLSFPLTALCSQPTDNPCVSPCGSPRAGADFILNPTAPSLGQGVLTYSAPPIGTPYHAHGGLASCGQTPNEHANLVNIYDLNGFAYPAGNPYLI